MQTTNDEANKTHITDIKIFKMPVDIFLHLLLFFAQLVFQVCFLCIKFFNKHLQTERNLVIVDRCISTVNFGLECFTLT